MACAAPLVAAHEQGARQVVTIVFSDLVGSTALGESQDSESLREVLTRYFERMREAVENHGGVIEKYIGDAVMAVFGLSHVHEDDALRAVRAASEMQKALRSLNEELSQAYGVRLANRTGVNTGEVVAGDPEVRQRLVTGDTVNTAARLEQAAGTNEVLFGDATYRLVRPLVEAEPVEPLSLKGKSEPVPAWRLVSILDAPPAAGQLRTPLVGREAELTLLEQALQRVRRDRSCMLVPVIADAGVGKTRLVREFLTGLSSDIKVLRGRCLSYGQGVTFWPVAEALRDAGRIEEDDTKETTRRKLGALLVNDPDRAVLLERLASVLGLSEESGAVEEIFWAIRRAFEGLAKTVPLVVVFEDIHWAEPTMLDLLGHLVSLTSAPLLLLAPARPELLEIRPGWEGDEHTTIVELKPLDEADIDRIVQNLLGSELADDIRSRIRAFSQGNPLYCEQIVSMWIDGGLLQQTGGEWRVTGTLLDLSVPPSISALLAARLDRLDANERAVIQRASVIGQIFYEGAVTALAPDELKPQVGGSLTSLATKELIHSTPSTMVGEESYRFGHHLIRDAAYRGLLKRTRADLHMGFAEWLEARSSERVPNYEEIRGYHLEQAYLIGSQLGLVDDHLKTVGRTASSLLGTVGRRAMAAGDLPAAGNLLRRASVVLDESEPDQPGLLVMAGEALRENGDFTAASECLTAAESLAEQSGQLGIASTAGLERLWMRYATEGATEAEVLAAVEQRMPLLETMGEHEGLARAWKILTLVHWTAERFGAAESAATRMIAEAELAHDDTMAIRMLPALAQCSLYGPTPVPEAIVRCEGLLERARGDRKAVALVQTAMAHLEAMRGDTDRGRELYREARDGLEGLGWKLLAALTSLDSAWVEMLGGDPAAAERELRADHEALAAMGERNYIASIDAILAEALLRQGKDEEADAFATQSLEMAADDDVFPQIQGRTVRARVLSRKGELEEAERLATEALALTEGSDDTNSLGLVLLAYGQVLRSAGKLDAALQATTEAEALFEAKGNRVSAALARELAALA
jgi:class 3 adenylate cyclase/tetratricopeptide (TPR) repeat protein